MMKFTVLWLAILGTSVCSAEVTLSEEAVTIVRDDTNGTSGNMHFLSKYW